MWLRQEDRPGCFGVLAGAEAELSSLTAQEGTGSPELPSAPRQWHSAPNRDKPGGAGESPRSCSVSAAAQSGLQAHAQPASGLAHKSNPQPWQNLGYTGHQPPSNPQGRDGTGREHSTEGIICKKRPSVQSRSLC